MLYVKDTNLQVSYWLIFRSYLGPHIFPHTFKYLAINALFLAQHLKTTALLNKPCKNSADNEKEEI